MRLRTSKSSSNSPLLFPFPHFLFLSLSNNPLPPSTIEDVVWSVLCRRDNGAAQQDLLREIKEMGVAHFGNNPVVYFSVLLLLQEYTEAVKYLYFESGSEDLAVEAVHMGVVLYRCGLLDREAEFAEILKDYIRRFSPQVFFFFFF